MTASVMSGVASLSDCVLPCCDRRPFAVLDLETTGLDRDVDEIVEIAVVHVDAEGRIERTWDTLVRPTGPVGATFVHGIDDAMVNDAPSFEQIAGDVCDLLSGRVLVAHNAWFDVRFLTAAFTRHDEVSWPRLPVVCTMLSSKVVGFGGFTALDVLRAELGFGSDQAHRARDDAFDTAVLLGHELHACRTTGQHLHRWGDPSAPLLPADFGPWPRTGERLTRVSV